MQTEPLSGFRLTSPQTVRTMSGILVSQSSDQGHRPAYKLFWINEAETALLESSILSRTAPLRWDEGGEASCRFAMLFR